MVNQMKKLFRHFHSLDAEWRREPYIAQREGEESVLDNSTLSSRATVTCSWPSVGLSTEEAHWEPAIPILSALPGVCPSVFLIQGTTGHQIIDRWPDEAAQINS